MSGLFQKADVVLFPVDNISHAGQKQVKQPWRQWNKPLAQRLHVDGHVRYRLGPVDHGAGAVTMGDFHHLLDRGGGAQSVGDLGQRDQLGLGGEQPLVLVGQDLAAIVHRGDLQPRALFGAELLPGNDVGTPPNSTPKPRIATPTPARLKPWPIWW